MVPWGSQTHPPLPPSPLLRPQPHAGEGWGGPSTGPRGSDPCRPCPSPSLASNEPGPTTTAPSSDARGLHVTGARRPGPSLAPTPNASCHPPTWAPACPRGWGEGPASQGPAARPDPPPPPAPRRGSLGSPHAHAAEEPPASARPPRAARRLRTRARGGTWRPAAPPSVRGGPGGGGTRARSSGRPWDAPCTRPREPAPPDSPAAARLRQRESGSDLRNGEQNRAP